MIAHGDIARNDIVRDDIVRDDIARNDIVRDDIVYGVLQPTCKTPSANGPDNRNRRRTPIGAEVSSAVSPLRHHGAGDQA